MSRFWEDLSLESLVEEDLFLLIGRAVGAPTTSAPTSGPSSSTQPPFTRAGRPERPLSIALPSPPRLPAAAKPSSPLSPKLYSWNFLKRNNVALSSSGTAPPPPAIWSSAAQTGRTTAGSGLPANTKVEVASAPRKHRRSLALPQGTSFDLEEAKLVTRGSPQESPLRPTRPGQSRSSTWTDSLPTVRTLSQVPPRAPSPTPAPLSRPPIPHSPVASSSPSRPQTTETESQEHVLLVPIVSPRKDNPSRGGRFGLFRRGSLSPRVEKTGFTIGASAGEEKPKRRKAVKDSSLDKEVRRRNRGSFTSLGARPSSSMSNHSSLWVPRAEEMRHIATTTASPPPEEVVSIGDFEPSSPLSDTPSQASYFSANPIGFDANGRRVSLPRSSLQTTQTADLHQLSQSPTVQQLSNSPTYQSPLRQSVDLPKPHIIFGAPNPASPLRASSGFPHSVSDSSLSLQTSDSDEDFPTRSGARKAVKAKKLHKAPIKIGRDRSCSPLRYQLGAEGRRVSDTSEFENLEDHGEEDRGRLRAWQWWRPSGSGTPPKRSSSTRPQSMMGSSVPTPSSSTDRSRGSRAKSTNPKTSQRGFKVTSRPISTANFPPTPPPSDPSFTPTPPVLSRCPTEPREPSPQPSPQPIANLDSLLTSTRPTTFTRQSTGNVSVRSSVVLRDWKPSKAAPAPPDARRPPPVNTSAIPERKDSLSPPGAGWSYDNHSPISAYGTVTEGEDATNSEQEVMTTEDGSSARWQSRAQVAESARSEDSDSIHQLLGVGQPATSIKA